MTKTRSVSTPHDPFLLFQKFPEGEKTTRKTKQLFLSRLGKHSCHGNMCCSCWADVLKIGQMQRVEKKTQRLRPRVATSTTHKKNGGKKIKKKWNSTNCLIIFFRLGGEPVKNVIMANVRLLFDSKFCPSLFDEAWPLVPDVESHLQWVPVLQLAAFRPDLMLVSSSTLCRLN